VQCDGFMAGMVSLCVFDQLERLKVVPKVVLKTVLWGRRTQGLVSRIGGLLDWLAELIMWSFKKSPLVSFENLPKKASPRAGEGLRKKTNVKCTPEDVL
jgi:hypothetical protein